MSSSLSILTTTLGCADISHLHIDKLENEVIRFKMINKTSSTSEITYLKPLELDKEPFCRDPTLHD
jgi:hypothetical protein